MNKRVASHRGMKRPAVANVDTSGASTSSAKRVRTTNSNPDVIMCTSVNEFKLLVGAQQYNTMLPMMCQKSIPQTYLNDAVSRTNENAEFTLRHVMDPGTRRFWLVLGNKGFAMGCVLKPALFGGHRIFYVSVVCSNAGKGKLLLAAMEDEARKLECSVMWLSSVPERTGFYSARGYAFGPGVVVPGATVSAPRKRGGKSVIWGWKTYKKVRQVRPNMVYKIPQLPGILETGHENGVDDGALMHKFLINSG